MKKLFYVLFLTFGFNLVAQKNPGTWNILNITMKVDPKWSFFSEGQIMSLSFYNEFHYYELKTGLTYKTKDLFQPFAND